ncbi:putative Metal dependent phosphohydrolase [Desulfamplus magnetovallimortis]|uniref:Putative Metal dependent phosphohydrolase n=1 Tax=Desulfamplus magnetovallimortis TaxID=1246637 RepID=A0A1W1HH03_9BACT|nr:CHASE2 domain-containing protein [Desulfamplus magnetovallimortis]SLM31730.1 putative Metal dependent phosphohydrolase [Desulfamplus magnetovallimortis]
MQNKNSFKNKIQSYFSNPHLKKNRFNFLNFHGKALQHLTEKNSMVVVGIFITCTFFLILLYQPSILSFLDQKIYDLQHKGIKSKGTPQPVIVDIDDKSLNEMGQWPWPRYLVAELLDIIGDAKPGSVGIDILFTEPDRTSPSWVLKDLASRTGNQYSFENIPHDFQDNDLMMARALKNAKFILASKFITSYPKNLFPKNLTILPSPALHHENGNSDFHGDPSRQSISHFHNKNKVNENKVNVKERLVHTLDTLIRSPDGNFDNYSIKNSQWNSLLAPLDLFTETASGTGFINMLPDSDGIIRRVPLITSHNGYFFPGFALATVMQQMNANKVIIEISSSGIEGLRINQTLIPLTSDGELLIHYRAPNEPFEILSASDLLNHRVNSKTLKGKMVFLGTSASGLGDFHFTPLSSVCPGVNIHATIADNIINKNFLSRPVWSRGLELFFTIITGLISTLIMVRLSPMLCLASLALMIFLLFLCQLEFIHSINVVISTLYPFLVMLTTFLFLSILRFRIGEKNILQKARQMGDAQNLTIMGISCLATKRDGEDSLHIRRTAQFVKIIAKRLSLHPDYADQLDNETIEMMHRSVPMHDIGKVAVPDAILLKAGKLTEEEFNEVKKHTEYGWQTICEAEKASDVEMNSSFLAISREIIRYHHEKWDGSGYNHGLKGKEIPLSARIMALADVYDALIRKMKRADGDFDHEKAKDIILQGKGRHFDPDIVDAFILEEEHLIKVSEQMSRETTVSITVD